MADSLVVSSLPDYVQTNTDKLIAKTVLRGNSQKYMTIQTGVKGKSQLNLLDTDVKFQDGSICGFTSQGTSTLSARNLVAGIIKVNMEFCEKSLVGKYAERMLSVAAGTERLPFEEEVINDIIANVNFELDKAIWQGDSDMTVSDSDFDQNLSYFDGLLTILAASDGVITTSGTEAAPLTAVANVLKAMPNEAFAPDAIIYASPEFVRSYVAGLVSANLFHYNPGNVDNGEISIPGSAIKLVSIDGLTGTNKLVAGRKSNIFFGCDVEGDDSKFTFQRNINTGMFQLEVCFSAATQVARPSEVVVCTLS